MKKIIIKSLIFLFALNLCNAQQWMTSLPVAQDLALVQNKMVLMVWEETTMYPYPVAVNSSNGKTYIVQNLFTDEDLSPLIWEHFVPVIVKEFQYEDLFLKMRGKRKQSYIDKFNDDSIKIMDANGYILNVGDYDGLQNISEIINKYALNTEFLKPESENYHSEQDFYSSFYLASKYMDFSIYTNGKTRERLINMANIYLYEAENFLSESNDPEKQTLSERLELLRIQQYLILGKAKKTLRKLKRLERDGISETNQPYKSFLEYTAYRILDDHEEAETLKSEISSLNLKKAQLIYNINS